MHKKVGALLLLGAAVFYLLFRFIGTTNIMQVLLNANPWIVGLSVFFQFFLMLCWTFRWELIIDYLKIKIPFKKLFPYLLFINFGDVITPGPRFGSEPLVVYLIEKNERVRADDLMASMLVERLYGLVTFNILSIFAIIILFLFVPVSTWLLAVILFSLAIAIGLSVFVVHLFYKEKEGLGIAIKITDKILKILYKLRHRHKAGRVKETLQEYESRFNKSIKMFFDDVVRLGKNPGLWVRGIFMSFVFYLICFMQTYYAFVSVGIFVPFYLVVIMMTLAELTGYLIMLPSAVGVTEVLMVAILSSYGISLGQAAAGTLIARGIYYIFGIVTGYISLLWIEEKE